MSQSTFRPGLYAIRTKVARGGVKALVVVTVCFLALPLVVVIPMSFSSAQTLEFPPPSWSFQYYEYFFSSSMWTSAAVTSFQVGILSALIATILGTMSAFALTQYAVPMRRSVQVLLLLPLVTPLVVAAVGYYRVFLDWGIANTVLGLTLAHAGLAMPFVLLSVVASLRKFDPRLSKAAASLGATPARTFFRVVLPSIRPGVIAGGFLAFLFSFNETVVAIFLVASRAQTLPKLMWDGILLEVDPVLSVVATLMTLMTVLVLVAQLVLRKRTSVPVAQQPGPSDDLQPIER